MKAEVKIIMREDVPAPNKADRPSSVLIVDDDVGTIDTLVSMLLANGYQVETAFTGAAAAFRAGTGRYDTVLMDITVPKLEGIEALRTIKALTPTSRVILMTAFTRQELVGEARQMGASEVVWKPLDMNQVIAAIEGTTTQTPERRQLDRRVNRNSRGPLAAGASHLRATGSRLIGSASQDSSASKLLQFPRLHAN